MNVKRIAKGLIVFFATFVIGFILHTSILGRLPIGVVTPNVLLLLTSAFGFMEGGMFGMCFGFVAGLMVDCFSPEYFGLNCLLFLFIGFLNGLFTRLFYGEDVRLPMLLIGGSDIIYGVLVYVLLFLTRQRYDFGFYFTNIIMPEAVYTVLIFLLLYYPFLKALKWYKDDGVRHLID